MGSVSVVSLRPPLETHHRHRSASQQSTAEPSTRDGTHLRKGSKRTRVFAIGPHGWGGGGGRRGTGDVDLRHRGIVYGINPKVGVAAYHFLRSSHDELKISPRNTPSKKFFSLVMSQKNTSNFVFWYQPVVARLKCSTG